VAPLLRGGEPVGALAVVRPNAFSVSELAQLSALALAATAGLAPGAAPRGAAPRAGPVAQSAVMKALLQTVQTVARAPTTVLFTGETGTGKEELARHLHFSSPRAKGPFVAVNCGAIPAELAESELFGHEKGAFTGAHAVQVGLFERADGGTLFLDEVGELPLPIQVKLLRVLQERCVQRVGGGRLLPVDVRVVAATHRPLEALVEKGQFRDDLFWRLNVVRLQVPPLRERPDDVLPLAQHLLQRLGATLGRSAPTLAKGAEAALARSSWPGNVRQLANALERALVLQAVPGPITAAELTEQGGATASAQSVAEGTLAQKLAVVEREAIVRALKAARGVKSAAAEALDISRPTLDRKLAEYEIDLFKGDGTP
jgi:DNA-binding NtrC family response regulator